MVEGEIKMYLHTGKGRIVFDSELIGIFNYDLLINLVSEKEDLQEFSRESQTKKQNNNSRLKSIIVTDREIFSAPISPQTLAGRSMQK